MIKEMPNKFSEISPEIKSMAAKCSHKIDPACYERYAVKRGLREDTGEGVLVGLTEISQVISYTIEDRAMVPCPGRLYFRGINIEDLVDGFLKEKRFGFEEVTYLLLFGELPTKEELKQFTDTIAEYRELPTNFVRDIIMKAPSRDMMNTLARSVLTLFSYDDNACDTSVENVLRQCLQLIGLFPVLAIYGYQAYAHYFDGKSLFIHKPQENLSIAENILYLLRPDNQYTELEARILDLCLIIHAEHGGGNNSTFTMHVVTSSGTDTYSAVAASLASLSGPKHGGANIKVIQMFDDIKKNISDWTDEEEVRAYLKKILNGEAFDGAGLIYGMGHAIYSISDPRAKALEGFVQKLAEEKGLQKEYALYSLVEKIAPQEIKKKRKSKREVSANVDFYSGFVYRMLGLPEQLYTPIFAIARISGWSAHRLEEIVSGGKIIRPAYANVAKKQEYVPLDQRKTEDIKKDADA